MKENVQEGVTTVEAFAGYIEAIERFDPEAAAAWFTADAFYSHPPYPGGISGGFDRGPDTRVEVRGRETLIELFRARGHRDLRHQVTTCVREGDVAFVEGVFEAPKGTGSFIVSLRLGDEGLIASLAAYASAPGVGEALAESA